MSADPISPGDWVECIESVDSGDGSITKGNLYRCAAIGDASDSNCYAHGPHCAHRWIDLMGQSVDPDWGWCAGSFRPIRSDITSLEKLLTQPIPEDIRREKVGA